MNKRRTRARILATAYHEAGHAVAAATLGGAVITSTITRKKDQFGLTEWSLPDPVDPRKRIIVTFAGPLAHHRHNPKCFEPDAAQSDFLDIDRIVEALDLPEEQQARFKSECEQEAERLLDENWVLIERVAEALFLHRTLNGLQAKAVLGDPEAAKICEAHGFLV
jgi:hypothetical protein